MENDVLKKINDIMDCDAKEISDLYIQLRGTEVLFLAQYIERLEEKEHILNALLGKNDVNNIVINNNK